MAKQQIVTVSAAFASFVKEMTEKYTGPGVTKDTNLTQAELSDALLAYVKGKQHYVEGVQLNSETGEEEDIIEPVSLEDEILTILDNREVGGGTRSSAKSKLDATIAKLEKGIAELKALGATPAMLAIFETQLAEAKGKKKNEVTVEPAKADEGPSEPAGEPETVEAVEG